MPLHESTFGYLNPTDFQKQQMEHVREAAAEYAGILQDVLPDGPDKTFVLRSLRTVAMWANVCITRHSDGKPRDETEAEIDAAVKEYPPDHPAPGDLGSVPL